MGSPASPADERVERAVLSLLLADGPPDGQTVERLIEQIGDRSATLRALDSLRAVGLAERHGERARPTSAARRFDELGL